MKRKYLSALLMGALTVTSVSTFTSCKDYDSDISNLQGQIDKAALRTEVEAMKTTVEAAKTAAESAKTTAEKNATDLTDVKAKAEKLATQVAEALQTGKDAKAAADEAKDQCDELELKFYEYYTAEKVDALLDELEAKIDANTESIEDLKAEVESYSSNINKLYSAVTGVSLVLTGNETFSKDLKFMYGTVKPYSASDIKDSYTFGEKEIDDKDGEHSATPTYTYKKDDKISFAQELLVRVNPVNANITKDMVKLVDSKGQTLDDLLDITKVEKYDGYMTYTKASSLGTGLWKITVKPKAGVDASKLDDMIPNKVNESNTATKDYVLHAVAINNTASATDKDAASRYVVSSYGVTVSSGTEYSAAENINDATITTERGSVTVEDAMYYDAEGNENGSTLVYAQNGEDIVISFKTDGGLENKIDRFYVVRDDQHAGDDGSGTSEINAWNKYKYTGLNEIKEVENGVGTAKISVTIPSDAKTGDEVQFRIFAINYDGTLAPVTGSAFRVYVGAETNAVKCIANGTFDGKESLTTGWQKITGTIADDMVINKYDGIYNDSPVQCYTLNGITYGYLTLVDNATEKAVKVKIQFAADENGTAADSNSKIKYFKVICKGSECGPLTNWTNNGLASAEVNSVDGATANNMKIIVTKVMPDAATAKALLDGKDWRANQLVNGVFDSYMYPAAAEDSYTSAAWNEDAAKAFKDMSKVYWLKENATVVIANAQKHTDDDADNGKYVDDLVAETTPWNVAVDPALVDNKTEHASAIKYNFGKIDSNSTEDLLVTIEDYKTIFSCPLVPEAQTLGWKQYTDEDKKSYDVNYLYYGTTESSVKDGSGKAIDLLKYITVVNKYDSHEFGTTMKELLKFAKSATVEVRSGSEKGNADYFTGEIKLTENATYGDVPALVLTAKTNGAPSDDVKSVFVIKVTDAFGHTHEYSVPFTVKVLKGNN